MKVNVKDYFYQLLHPRPVSLIVSMSASGEVNVMSCSWNTPVSEDPPLIMISIWKKSYTHELIMKSREFTLNIPSSSLLNAVIIAGTRSGRKVNKIKEAKLSLKPSKKIRTPIVEQCIGHLECRVVKDVDAGECTVFIAEVLEAYADRKFFSNKWKLNRVDLLLHLKSKEFTVPKQTLRK